MNMLRKLVHALGRSFAAWAIALVIVIVLPAVFAVPAFAQDAAASDAGVSFTTVILTAIATALVPLLLAGWGVFVAYAAKSEATWDDWIVARVEQVARGLLEKAGYTVTPPPASSPSGSSTGKTS